MWIKISSKVEWSAISWFKFYSIQSADWESSKRTIHLVQNNETAFAEENALYTAFNETDFIRKMSDISQHIPVVYARHMPFVDFDKATFFPAMQRILDLIKKITWYALKIKIIFRIEIHLKINLVRDPIEQFISHFNFKRNGDFAKQHANNPDKFSALNYVS